MLDSSLFFDFIVLLGATAMVSTVCYALKLPFLLGFILAGALVGPHGLGLIKNLPNVSLLTEIGSVLLMFTIGLEFSIKKILKLKRWIFGPALYQVFGTGLLVYCICYFAFDISIQKSLVFSFIITLSSTATVMKLLEEERDTNSMYGHISLSILLVQDLAVIIMIMLLPLLAASTGSMESLSLLNLGKGLVAIVAVLVGAKFIIPKFLESVAQTKNKEVFFFSIVFIATFIAYIMHHIGLSLSLGAFIAGLMISESAFGKQATSTLMPLRDHFLGLFFATIGMLLSFSFISEHFWQILTLGLGIYLLKILVVFVFLKSMRFSAYFSLVVGFLLFQIGEFSFILIDQAAELNILSSDEKQILLTISAISIGLTPLMFRVVHNLKNHIPFIRTSLETYEQVYNSISMSSKDKSEKLSGHTVIIGFGVAGQNVAKALKSLKIPYIIIELNNKTVKKYKSKGEPIIYGDASSLKTLYQAHINTAKLVVISVSGHKMTQSILTHTQNVGSDLRVLVRTQFFQDLNSLQPSKNTQFIVAEFEASLELLAQTLTTYGVDTNQAYNFTLEAKRSLLESHNLNHNSAFTDLDKYALEAFANIYPIRISEGDFAHDKDLSDLDLRRKTGATVVCVFREKQGVMLPSAEFQIQNEDILYLIGPKSDVECAKALILGESKIIDA